MVVPSILGLNLVNALTASGTLVAVAVAAIVFFDARGAGLSHAPAWAVGVGAASVASFVVANTVAVQAWGAVNANPDGPLRATTPFEILTYGVGIGVLLPLLVLFGYGFGSRLATDAVDHGAGAVG